MRPGSPALSRLAVKPLPGRIFMPVTRRSLVVGAAIAPIASRVRAQGPIRWRFAHPHPESDSWHKAALRFAELMKERTKGQVEIQIFGGGVLGNDPTMVNAVRGGSLDIGLTGNPYFTGLAPKLNVLDLPFLFQDRKHVAAVLDGPVGDELRKELEGSSLKALATWDIGWRNLTNNRRAIRGPDDLKGLKIRTTPNPAHIKAFQLLGAVPTPMAFTELFTALEMGSVDGQENPVTLILNAKFFEVQKHLTMSRHAFTTGPLIMNKAKFDALAPDLQKTLVDTARETARLQWAMNTDTESSSLAELKDKGMQVVETVDREAFRKIVADAVRKDFVEKFGADLPARIDTAAA
jgi:tripartite ATP-independent transporter DctP family solute receptor